MSGTLIKVIAARYYRVNTGFFLLLFLLLFGILNGRETLLLHYGIMRAMTTSWAACGIAMAVWAAYMLKCLSFGLRTLREPRHTFLFELRSLTDCRLFRLLLGLHAVMYLPLLAYGAMAVGIGMAQQRYALAGLFLLFLLAGCAAGTRVYRRAICGTWKQPLLRLPAMSFPLRKSFSFYLVHYSLHYRKRTFAGVKALSLLSLQVMAAANGSRPAREAVCVLMMFLVSVHALLPVYYVQFTEQGMPWLRNMPVSALRRYGVYALTYAIIFLPELLFLLLNQRRVMPVQLSLSLYALAISQSLVYTGILYLRHMRTERYSMWVFFIFFLTLLLLASLQLWPVVLAEALLATIMFMSGYGRYEVSGGEG